MNIEEHLNGFIQTELDEAVERLHDEGIIYETDYHFTWQHNIIHHYDYVKDRLIEAGLDCDINSVTDFLPINGSMFAIYNTSKFSYQEAKELLIKKYYT